MLAVVGFGVGCGESDDSGGGDGASADVAKYDDQLEELYAGTYEEPPSTAPQAEPGKNVWIISFGQAQSLAAAAAGGASDAATMLGWNPTIFDSKFDPALAANGISDAIASGADGIILYVVDCELVRGPLQRAKAANIPVIGVESLDCSDTDPNAPSLFTASPPYVEGPFPDWIRKVGEAQAIWTIAQTDGEARVLYPRTDEAGGFRLIREGTENVLTDCVDCTLTFYAFRSADIGATLQQETESALLQNPDTNAMITPVDALVVGGLASALKASGRDDINVIGAEGDPAAMDIIREGDVGTDAGVGTPGRWEGFAGVDALLRVFADEPVESSGIGIQVFDADHNLPATGAYKSPVDFEAAYKKAWGVN